MYETDELLENFLEADQISTEAERPVAPAALSRGMRWFLLALRAFVVVVGAMVVYVFVSQLSG